MTDEIEVLTVPLPRFRAMLSNGETACSGCVAAGFLALAYVERTSREKAPQ